MIIKLYIRDLSVRNIDLPDIVKDGIKMDDLPSPKQYTENINGHEYHVVEFQTYFYPLRTGALSVGAVRITANILYKQSSSGSQGNGFFDDDFSK